MKKTTIGALMLCLFAGLFVGNSNAQVATKVAWYDFPVSLPDVTTPEFGTARDNLLTKIKMGGELVTGSRVNNPLGLEIRLSAEAGDFAVSPSNVALWRGVFSPGGVYSTQHGQRRYGTVLVVGVDGKVSLSRLSYEVHCGVGLLSNASDLAGLSYSVSRIGINAGPDGRLWTPDDQYLQNGESGTTLVDAVLFIGARIGAGVSSDVDVDSLNAAIGPDGTFTTYRYIFKGDAGNVTHECMTWIYPQGQIPSNMNRVEVYRAPKGFIFSLVGPAGSPPVTLHTGRKVTGPWTLLTGAATEGASAYLEYTGSPSDWNGFVLLGDNLPPGAAAGRFGPQTPGAKLTAVSDPGVESDQDR